MKKSTQYEQIIDLASTDISLIHIIEKTHTVAVELKEISILLFDKKNYQNVFGKLNIVIKAYQLYESYFSIWYNYSKNLTDRLCVLRANIDSIHINTVLADIDIYFKILIGTRIQINFMFLRKKSIVVDYTFFSWDFFRINLIRKKSSALRDKV